MRCQGCWILLFLLVSVFPLLAQQVIGSKGSSISGANSFSFSGPFALNIKRQVEEVNLILSVTDRKGHFVEGLEPSDLTILDDDRKQTAVTFFQSQTNLPLHVGLVLDVSASVTEEFQMERTTIRDFLRQATRPSDSVELFAFNQSVRFVAPIQNDWKQVSRRVKELKPNGETALFDAVSIAAQWLAQDPRPARHIIILVTDGEDNASKMTLDEAIAQVLRAETTVYSVNVVEDPLDNDAKNGVEILKKLSDATGGAYLRAGQNGNVGRAFSRIQRELRSQYAIAYKPTNLTGNLFHHLKVIAARNLRVRCRTGYYVW
jgi:Ca-activated chloride channel homolog